MPNVFVRCGEDLDSHGGLAHGKMHSKNLKDSQGASSFFCAGFWVGCSGGV
jgi:hypothetical protein